MVSNLLRTPILILLLIVGGSVSLCPLVAIGDDTHPFCLLEEVADSDDVEESSEFRLIATLEPLIGLCRYPRFHSVTDEVNHQIDWLFVHEHAARAPPLG